jgi:ATP-dependent Clp protease ATP-binding subunit ClpA
MARDRLLCARSSALVLTCGGQQLRPELVGRMTEKVVFNRLPYTVQREICEHMIALEQTRLRDLGHTIEITPENFERLLREGHHKTLGVRPMRSAVERHMQGLVIFISYGMD